MKTKGKLRDTDVKLLKELAKTSGMAQKIETESGLVYTVQPNGEMSVCFEKRRDRLISSVLLCDLRTMFNTEG